jgi:triosephosphate isomerase
MSQPIVIANWKMHFTQKDVLDFCSMLARIEGTVRGSILIAPPSIYIGLLASSFPELNFASQDVSIQEHQGPYTGEISATQLRSCHVKYSIVGHSERRIYNLENNFTTKQKAKNCLDAGVTPIICIGEPLEIRQSGKHLQYIHQQLTESIPSSTRDGSFMLAYEPLWAVGTGILPTSEQLKEVYAHIMSVAKASSLMYGGSVNSNNTSMLSEIHHLDGLLVGGASLNSSEFIRIVEYWMDKC